MAGGELFQPESQCPDVTTVTEGMMLFLTRSMDSVVSPATSVTIQFSEYATVLAHVNALIAKQVLDNMSTVIVLSE